MGERTLAELGGWPAILRRLVAREDLDGEHARAALAEILDGAATPAQIAGFVLGLRMKGETVEEMAGFVSAMLEAAERVDLSGLDAVDTCGTGGSAARRTAAFNVSTIASFVIAGAGAPVCKHGNRAASSTSGSADVLEALGVVVDLDSGGVEGCVREAGIGFCFAPRFHPAMRHAVPARRELGIPTVFNFLGPLANPAGVRRQVLGVSDPAMAEKMVGVLRARGAEHALVVYGHDGLDELTTTTTSTVHELRRDEVRTFAVDPGALGLDVATPDLLCGGDTAANAELAHRVLAGERGPHRDLVALNAAAGLVAAGRAATIAEGLEAAVSAIDDGRAAGALDRMVVASRAARDAGGRTTA